jgi:hypothetical protein
MQTTLNLLTHDGIQYMSFAPHLSADQYRELLGLSELAESRCQLRELVQEWASANGLRLSFEEGKELADA